MPIMAITCSCLMKSPANRVASTKRDAGGGRAAAAGVYSDHLGDDGRFVKTYWSLFSRPVYATLTGASVTLTVITLFSGALTSN